nr:MAG TPA: hypothetical protein [Caudoviricetes sp.]
MDLISKFLFYPYISFYKYPEYILGSLVLGPILSYNYPKLLLNRIYVDYLGIVP